MKRIKSMPILLGLLMSFLVIPLQASNTEHGLSSIAGSAKADKLDSCIRETSFMRRNHMELMKHQRDITVHEGVRKTDNSIAGCIDCHVGHDKTGAPVPVNAPGEFCAACHNQVATTMDCFSCHSAIPRDK